ncbi:unnamed protein product [Linum tenue]|uniref:Aminotransferase-like plant mobile domain-containing protein n=1 Tax=Linum tenue TaxID=586396 RepID=A0AAV0I4Z8_9ROSI|nr:unnamed protein product [Linum tenue]
MNSDASLITALVERWRPETSTIHIPFGEITITLEDVVTLSGLAIDGDAFVVDIPDEEWSEICLRLLGRVPVDLSGGVGVLFLDRSGATVHLQYLLLIEDWQRAGQFPGELLFYPTCTVKWLLANSRQYGDQLFQYKLWFDAMDTVVWQPYLERALHLRGSVIQSETFRAVMPLICFSSVMWHHLDHVLRQFGMRQHEPHPPHPEAEVRFFLRQTTNGPSRGQQLIDASRESLAFWNRRHEFVATTPYTDEELAYHSEHIEWYRDVTRRSGTRRGDAREVLYDTIEHAECDFT